MGKIKDVPIPLDGDDMTATIGMPDIAKGMVIFSHGLGSSRFSPRNRKIAERLQNAGFATVLCDLHEPHERGREDLKFNLKKMALKLEFLLMWLKKQRQYEMFQPALFGSSTGAAVAMKVASEMDGIIKAIVCRGGRIDLAGDAIDNVHSPTLLILGELDFKLIEKTKSLYKRLPAKKEIAIVPGASHLFEEPNKLEDVANISIEWFNKYLIPSTHPV